MMVTTTNKKRKDMTNFTGSNNLAGLLGGLVETIETVVGFAEQKLSDFAEGGETDQSDDETRANYKAVFNLGLSDQLVLEDGSWQVLAVESDAFDPDIVLVTVDNGETYALLRTSLVRVV